MDAWLCHFHGYCHFSSTYLIIVHTKMVHATKSEPWSYPLRSQTISSHCQKVQVDHGHLCAKPVLIRDQPDESRALKLMIAVEEMQLTCWLNKKTYRLYICNSSFCSWKETMWCKYNFLHSYQRMAGLQPCGISDERYRSAVLFWQFSMLYHSVNNDCMEFSVISDSL